jgi:hypothetical protein
MLSLWKCSFGPCSERPIDADAYIGSALDTFLTSLKHGAPQADATDCVNHGAKRSRNRSRR